MKVLLLHAAATLFMTGLIWFVQVVHYPMFANVGREGFSAYAQLHSALTTWVVAPVMLVELAAAFYLLTAPQVPRWLSITGAVLLAIVWLSTLLLQVPRHEQLSHGFDATAHFWLVRTNWIRTIGWSLRAVVSLAMVKTLT
jgi:hypothetical protein